MNVGVETLRIEAAHLDPVRAGALARLVAAELADRTADLGASLGSARAMHLEHVAVAPVATYAGEPDASLAARIATSIVGQVRAAAVGTKGAR